MGLSRKLVFTVLLLVAVFLISFLVAFFAFSLTPYGHVTERVYSPIFPYSYADNDTSTIGGAWQSQLLSPQPEAGSTNVSRDTTILIIEPRPIKIENLTLSPPLPITIKSSDYVFSAYMEAYPAALLQPNTTYNVSAIVAGTPSWWIFTTSSEPSQPTFSTHLAPYDTWVAFTAAILVTLTVSVILIQRKTNTWFLGNSVTNTSKPTPEARCLSLSTSFSFSTSNQPKAVIFT